MQKDRELSISTSTKNKIDGGFLQGYYLECNVFS